MEEKKMTGILKIFENNLEDVCRENYRRHCQEEFGRELDEFEDILLGLMSEEFYEFFFEFLKKIKVRVAENNILYFMKNFQNDFPNFKIKQKINKYYDGIKYFVGMEVDENDYTYEVDGVDGKFLVKARIHSNGYVLIKQFNLSSLI